MIRTRQLNRTNSIVFPCFVTVADIFVDYETCFTSERSVDKSSVKLVSHMTGDY